MELGKPLGVLFQKSVRPWTVLSTLDKYSMDAHVWKDPAGTSIDISGTAKKINDKMQRLIRNAVCSVDYEKKLNHRLTL